MRLELYEKLYLLMTDAENEVKLESTWGQSGSHTCAKNANVWAPGRSRSSQRLLNKDVSRGRNANVFLRALYIKRMQPLAERFSGHKTQRSLVFDSSQQRRDTIC